VDIGYRVNALLNCAYASYVGNSWCDRCEEAEANSSISSIDALPQQI
jgi:hypothetical protein